ncbi:exonuclease domain-containing protein [Robertmurraya sp. DFI.2.37]|uniref:exonuclease domain-containing protein n=1 Tax=Robertmurraya sp. DFI.2.37 TaxID=3031819 RepID=UPI00177B175F|nr:exonuclease domain-containing protein [Robertmurraya sp. DFI.2.37]MDF1511275.1 exonuclease domain-containing protein [Robertmurraya sp. DFI.2.37]
MPLESFRQLMRGIQGRLSISDGNLQSSQQIAFIRQMQKELKQESVLYTKLDELNVVVFDIETTGFYPELGDEIISIGAVRVRNGKMNDEEVFYSLVRYEQELPLDIESLTGITSSELKEAKPLSEVMIAFFEFVQNETLVAHHAKHEKSFLQNASWKLFRTPFKHRIIDTSFLYRIAEREHSLSRLEDLCEYNGIEVMARHHALGDAKLTARLWCIYIEKLKALGCKNLHDVYERLARL